MPWASTCGPAPTSSGPTLDDGDGADRAPVGQRVDHHQRVPGLEQVVGEVQAADAVVDHPDAVGPGLGGQPADDLAAEPVVGPEHVPDAGDEDRGGSAAAICPPPWSSPRADCHRSPSVRPVSRPGRRSACSGAPGCWAPCGSTVVSLSSSAVPAGRSTGPPPGSGEPVSREPGAPRSDCGSSCRWAAGRCRPRVSFRRCRPGLHPSHLEVALHVRHGADADGDGSRQGAHPARAWSGLRVPS